MTLVESIIAIYLRISTKNQIEGYSIPLQREKTNAFIDLYQDKYPGQRREYLDNGVSAKNLNRAELQNLITDIKAGFVKIVVIYSLDRLTRSIKDWLMLFDLFRHYDVQLISMKESIDTSTVQGRFFVMIIILVAEWERDEISERTRTRMRQAIRDGDWIFANAPYGFNVVNKKLIPDEIESEVVKRIFCLYLFDEYSAFAISQYLSSMTDTTFSWDRVRKILSNPIYIGKYVKDEFEVPGFTNALISEKVFEETQMALKFRNEKDSLEYLFRRKCFAMSGEPLVVDSSSKNGGEKVYLYYYSKELNKRVNEDYINEQVSKYIDNYIHEEYLSELMKLAKKKSDKESEINTVSKMYRDGIITKKHYKKMVKQVNQELSDIEFKKLIKKAEIIPWEKMEPSSKVAFVKRYINRIIINVAEKLVKDIEFN